MNLITYKQQESEFLKYETLHKKVKLVNILMLRFKTFGASAYATLLRCVAQIKCDLPRTNRYTGNNGSEYRNVSEFIHNDPVFCKSTSPVG